MHIDAKFVSTNMYHVGVIKMKTLQIQIRSAQNVGKVWISRKKNIPAPFGDISDNFLCGPEKSKKYMFLHIFAIFTDESDVTQG